MEKVIPRAINYADIKPEAIENMIKVVRFTPTATTDRAKANDIVRFQLMGNGFYDPYSSYLRIEIEKDMAHFTAPTTAVRFVGMFLDRSGHSVINRFIVRSQGTELERIEQYDVIAAMINDMLYSQEQSILHHYEGFPYMELDVGSVLFSGATADIISYAAPFFLMRYSYNTQYRYLCDYGFWRAWSHGTLAYRVAETYLELLGHLTPLSNATSTHGLPTEGRVTYTGVDAAAAGIYYSSNTLILCIPLYSGIIGVLQQDHKFIPLSLMPLELEFTLNPHAFYSVAPAWYSNNREYVVTKMWLYSHVLFFEYELHRSLESVVAENGVFIHFNSFYLAPVATHTSQNVLNYAQINIHAKSINSIHFVFIYTGFEQPTGFRKLCFQNHNLTFMQIRNGTELIPSEAVIGDQYAYKFAGAHVPFLLETFKSWNKMHDPTTDATITPFNYVVDRLPVVPVSFLQTLYYYAQLGRCYYGITLEGEEIGADKTLISGKKGLIPFDVNMQSAVKNSNVTSFYFTFVKADYIAYVRPDLVVSLLGR